MFGRATITLGIGPHSSYYISCLAPTTVTFLLFNKKISAYIKKVRNIEHISLVGRRASYIDLTALCTEPFRCFVG